MRKILIWRKIVPGDGVDIFVNTDYRRLHTDLDRLYNGESPNWGNKLWYQAIYSVINTSENQIYIRTDETIEEINSNYDLIIYPMANFFGVEYTKDMILLADIFEKITIPVYVIACGVQAKSYDELETLICQIGKEASRFIEAIYHTGGEFALRGNFSKEFFTRLGYTSAVVTGCPSMYQLGRKFRMEKQKVPLNDVVPLINGDLNCFEQIMKKKSASVFMDQDTFANPLYRPDYLKEYSLKKEILFAHNYSCYQAELLAEGRIRMIVDMNDWYHYIQDYAFNYSYGTRIHGNIMSVLAGIPATVIAKDSRTREMAEFFEIPCIIHEEGKKYSLEDLEQAYINADYSRFNESFKEKYELFENFLKKHNIVTNINEKNVFFEQQKREEFLLYSPNQDDFMKFSKRIKYKKPILWIGERIINIKNK